MKTILQIDSSARTTASITRKLSNQLVEKLNALDPDSTIIRRDLSHGVPLLTETMVDAYYTAPDQRSAEQKEAIQVSDTLVNELIQADTLVIGAPIYNFGVPAALKAWFDLVARVGVTFRYSEKGPEGLLQGKKAYIIIGSGGTAIDSPIDFATGHLRQFLTFLGITDVELVKADQLMFAAEEKLSHADAQIAAVTL